jgi:hypothetical protein
MRSMASTRRRRPSPTSRPSGWPASTPASARKLGGTSYSTGTTTGPAPNTTGQWVGAGLTAASLLSDRDAKEDIERIGKMNDGTPIYRFRYKGSQQMHVGPMAQDVERRHPDSVSRGVDGYRYVDMEGATDDSVARRAEGGGVGGVPWGAAQSWIPTIGIHGGSGAPSSAGHAPSAPNSGQSAFDPSKLSSGISGAAKGIKSLDWGGAYDAGVGNLSGDSWGGGSFMGGDAYGGSSSNPLPGFDALDYGEGFADGGPVFAERFEGEPRSGAWDHFKGGAKDFFGGMHDMATGVAPRSPVATSRALWERDRRNGYARGGTVEPDVMNGDPSWSSPDVGPGYYQPGVARALPPDHDVRNGDPAWDSAGVPTPRPRPEPTFSDRFAPAAEGVASGTMQSRDDTVVNPGDPVRLQGSTYGPQAPPAVAAGDDEEDATPPNATPTSGPGVAGKPPSYYDRPDDIRPRQREGWGLGLLSPNVQHGLLSAGLGMLASRSPNLGNVLGEGGLTGLAAYGSAETADRKMELEAAKLSREANKTAYDRWMGERKQGETERHNKESEKKEAQTRIPSGYRYDKAGNLQAIPGGPADEGVVERLTKARGKNRGVNDEDAEAVANYYVETGDTSRLNALGVTSEARQRVQHFIKQKQARDGVTDAEMGTRTAEWAGRKAAQRTLATQEAKMGSAAFEAEGAIKLARGVIERLPRTSFLPFNELLQGFSKKTLNPDQAELFARAQAIVNTYSAVMARGANITTDSSRHHAAELLNTAFDPPTFNRIMNTMLNEIELAKHSPARMREFYRQQYGPKALAREDGTTAPGGGAAVTPPAGDLQEGRKGTKNGRPVIVQGGKLIYSDDGTPAQ